MRNEQSCPQAPSEARDKAHAQARRQRACGVQGQSPQRSLRQSLIRRQPTRCRYNEKKHTKVVFLIKSNNGAKICTAYPQLQRKSAKSKAILRRDEVGVELQGTAPSTSRYFSPVELLEHITIMYPKTILHHGGDNYFVIFPFGNRKNPTLKIQQLRRYISERNAKPLHCSCVFSQIVVNNKITKVVLLSQKFVKSGRINCIFAYCKNQK